VYVATHTGLFTIEDGTARRVGDRYHDLMGFTIAGPDDFLASGHPDLNDQTLLKPEAPPLLGLVASDDGQDWQPVSLLGEVDSTACKPPTARSTATTPRRVASWLARTAKPGNPGPGCR
jgi:hypothetical protein